MITLWTSGPSRPRLLAPKVTHGQLRIGEPPHHRYSGKTSAGDDCVAAVPAKPESRSEGSRAQGTHSAGLLPSNLRGPLPKGLSGLNISLGLKAQLAEDPGAYVGLSDSGRTPFKCSLTDLELEGFPPLTGILPRIPGPLPRRRGQQDGAWSTQSNAHLPHENLSNPEPNSRATTCDESHLVPERKNRLFTEAPVQTSLMVHWLGLHAPNAGGTGATPGQETRPRMPQPRSSAAK